VRIPPSARLPLGEFFSLEAGNYFGNPRCRLPEALPTQARVREVTRKPDAPGGSCGIHCANPGEAHAVDAHPQKLLYSRGSASSFSKPCAST